MGRIPYKRGISLLTIAEPVLLQPRAALSQARHCDLLRRSASASTRILSGAFRKVLGQLYEPSKFDLVKSLVSVMRLTLNDRDFVPFSNAGVLNSFLDF